jgi:hypothetical protein
LWRQVARYPDEVEAYLATPQECQILNACTSHCFRGMVAGRLDALYERTGGDEIMLAVGGHSSALDKRGIELIADHYNLTYA